MHGVSLIVIGLGVGLVALSAWSRAVLSDEERYLRAVAPLAKSPRFCRLCGTAVALGSRHHRRSRRTCSPTTARALGAITFRTMRAGSFHPIWIAGHRALHRHRRPSLRIAAAMVALAAVGLLSTAFTRVKSSVENDARCPETPGPSHTTTTSIRSSRPSKWVPLRV